MEVYVNNEVLPIELEGEKTAFEVIKGIVDFFAKEESPQFVTKILIDGTEYSYADDESLKSIAIDSINKIEFEFKDIIGNTEVKDYLIKSVKQKNILHSYLFLGTSGIGKLLVAKAFAKKVL